MELVHQFADSVRVSDAVNWDVVGAVIETGEGGAVTGAYVEAIVSNDDLKTRAVVGRLGARGAEKYAWEAGGGGFAGGDEQGDGGDRGVSAGAEAVGFGWPAISSADDSG
jgi:hypothetical protein